MPKDARNILLTLYCDLLDDELEKKRRHAARRVIDSAMWYLSNREEYLLIKRDEKDSTMAKLWPLLKEN